MTKRKKPKPKPAPKKASNAKRSPQKKQVEATAASTPIETTTIEGGVAPSEAAVQPAEPRDASASQEALDPDDASDASTEDDELGRAEDETDAAPEQDIEGADEAKLDEQPDPAEQPEPSDATSSDDDQVTTSVADLPKSSASEEAVAEPSDFPPPIPSERVPPPAKQPAGKRRKGKPALPTDDDAETIVWAGTARRDSTTDVTAVADDGDEVVSSVGTLREGQPGAREIPEDLEVTVNLTADLVPMPERDDLSEPTRNRLSDDDEPSPESLATTHVLSGDDAEKLGEALEASDSSDDTEAPDVDEDATDEPASEAGDDAKTPSQAETQTKLPLPESVTESHLRGLLEALVFASDSPVRAGELARRSQAPLKEVKRLLGELRTSFQGRGIQLDEVGGAWVFRTNPVYAPFVRELTGQKPIKLTRAQIETLSILAYRQPITRPEIDDIRGVDSGPVLKMLLERDLIKILGKKDEPGRPILYGTTTQFLEFFGIPSLKDLPTLREFTELNEDSKRVVEKELGESYEAISADLAAEAAIEGTEDLGAFDPTVEEPAEDPLGDRRVDEALAEIERATADPSEDETVALADKDLEAPEAVEEVAEALASDDDEDDEDEDDDDDDEDDEDDDEDDEDDEDE